MSKGELPTDDLTKEEVMPGICYAEYRSTIWNRLGFNTCYATINDEDFPDMPPAYITTNVFAHFHWLDRLRILLSGKVMVAVATKTNVVVETAISASKVSVLPLTYPLRKS